MDLRGKAVRTLAMTYEASISPSGAFSFLTFSGLTTPILKIHTKRN